MWPFPRGGRWTGSVPAVPTLLRHGTPAQVERFAASTLRGEISWCQLLSEPEAGSALASLRTRAEGVNDGWRLTGQKVWTSLACQADWCGCRTTAWSSPCTAGSRPDAVDVARPVRTHPY